MRRNLLLMTLLGVTVAAAAPAAQAQTAADHIPNCSNVAAGSVATPTANCGVLKVCISDLTAGGVASNEGTTQFEVEGQGPTGGDYLWSKILNAAPPTGFTTNSINNNPDPSSTGTVTAAGLGAGFTPAVNTATETVFPCIGSVNSANQQIDDAGISVPPGTYTIYPGKYVSANCLSTINGHVQEQPSGTLFYSGQNTPNGTAQRCHARVHHFHVQHASNGTTMSVVEVPYITVYVPANDTTTVLAHVVDDRYPDCQVNASPATNPQRVCEPTPGPAGP